MPAQSRPKRGTGGEGGAAGCASPSVDDDIVRFLGAALLAPHPEWQGAYDQDGPTAVATRRKLIDRVIADKMMICGAHFPFPGAGVFAKDGDAYTFTPVVQS